MALIANRRSVMTLFSDPACIQSHRTRIVLSEKDITADVVQIDENNKPEDLSELNPYNSVPTLVDRDLVLYDSRVIMEYFDERFPHPPLMPVDPVSRSKSRLALFHIEKDWYAPVDAIINGDAAESEQARKILEDSLISSIELFSVKPFFLSDEFSLVDCSIAPLLWRLPSLNINLPADAKAIVEYGNRVFDRPSFRSSLSEEELEMRPI
ncbi:MAG: glutathione S-transferase N-terminal domain-containing protein [Gammaproteobacteria bacterium]|nr:glutathione S-transferase N-terminal domain-containing protein [Gammaproteobacteria bacterium]